MRKKISSELDCNIAIFNIDRDAWLYLGRNCNIFVEKGFNELFQIKL